MKVLRIILTVLLSGLLLLALVIAALSFELDRTLLNVGYIHSEVKRADPVTLGLGYAQGHLPADHPEIFQAMLDAVADARPTIEIQLSTAIDAVHGYLTGKRDTPDFPLNAEPLRAALRARLSAALRKNPPAELKDAKPEELDKFVDDTVNGALEKTSKIPDTITLQLLPPDQAEHVVELRLQIHLIQTLMLISYVAAAVLLALVWRLGSMRLAGILTAVAGVFVYGVHALLAFAATRFVPANLKDMPENLRALVPGILDRALDPLAIFGVGCLALGVLLFAVSFFVRRSKPAPTSVDEEVARALAAPPPPPKDPNWLQRNPGKSAGIAVVVLVILALWPGDAIARYHAHQACNRGRTAQAAGDWATALAAFRDSTKYRPSDSALSNEYETAQGQWLHSVDAKIASLPPEERWNFFNDPAEVAIRQGLSEPLAAGHAAFIEQNRDLVCDHIEAAFTEASALLDEHKWPEAEAKVESVKPFAAAHVGFRGLLDHFAEEMAGKKLEHAVQLADTGEIALARALLAELKDSTYIEPDELADATYRVNRAEFDRQVDAAVTLGNSGDFSHGLAQLAALDARAKELQADPAHARSLAQLSVEERSAFLPSRLALARHQIRVNATQAQGRKIVQAVRAGNAAAAQSALDDLARLSGRSFAATGELLLQEKDFVRFEKFMLDLELAGEPDSKSNRLDVALVAAVRSHFTDQAAVRRYLADGYTNWAGRVARQGYPALELYLSDLSFREGGDAKDPTQALEKFAKEFTCFVQISPTTVKEGSVSSTTNVVHDAIVAALARTGSPWLKLVNAGGDGQPIQLEVRSVVSFPTEEHTRSDSTWSVHYQSGTRTENNPDYINLVQQLQQAQSSLQSSRQAAAQISSQPTSDNPYAALVTTAASAYSNASVEEAATRVNQLSAQLASTPPTLSFPVYADEAIPVAEHRLTHAADVEVTLFDQDKSASSSAWSAKLLYTTREWPGSARANVTGQRATMLDRRTASDRLAHDLAAKIVHQPEIAFRPLAQRLSRQLEEKLKDAPPLTKAEQTWAFVQLLRAGGVRVDGYAQQEAIVQRVLDLANAGDGGAAAKLPEVGHAYENSLGMRLVPVKGTDVLFSIWETRVQDFTAFVNETHYDAIGASTALSMSAKGWVREGRTWKNPGFAQEPTHPVCALNWEDANAFCAWLTKKERAAGHIGADQEYRLPTDAEWSTAAGMVEVKNGTPEQKMGLSADYSWGSDWPPPAGVGNLAGYEVRNGTWPDNWVTLPALGDGYAATAPVGQFSANPFGLYDMDGNVEEWCADAFNTTTPNRVLRGSSFASATANQIQLSVREGAGPQLRATSYGFRVVLSLGESLR